MKPKLLGTIKYVPGWMGGDWLMNGIEFDAVCKIKILEKYIDARFVGISGTDDDMGHRYDWKNKDLVATVPTLLGDVDISVKKLDACKQGIKVYGVR